MGKILSKNVRYYPSQTNLEEGVEVTVVLVEGDIGDYAAYVGHGSPEWVKRFGNKLRFEEAKIHFHIGLEEEKYRQ